MEALSLGEVVCAVFGIGGGLVVTARYVAA